MYLDTTRISLHPSSDRGLLVDQRTDLKMEQGYKGGECCTYYVIGKSKSAQTVRQVPLGRPPTNTLTYPASIYSSGLK